MDGRFGARGGRINKQGLVGVFYAERDICGEPGPKGFPIIYSADGMTLDRLGSTAAVRGGLGSGHHPRPRQ